MTIKYCNAQKKRLPIPPKIKAGMVELADTSDSKSDTRKGVGVRFPLPAYLSTPHVLQASFPCKIITLAF